MKLIMTLLVRDEADIVRQNLEFHLGRGVDFIVATDNGSVDGTREILDEYQRLGVARVLDEGGRDYAQGRWVTRMALMARDEYRADWILNSDADEFWWSPDQDLERELSAVGVDMLSCRRRHMIEAYEEISDDPWPERLIYHAVSPMPVPDLGNPLVDPLPAPYYYLDLPPKVICRARALLSVGQGNHHALYAQSASTRLSGVIVYHYPVRSPRQLEMKIRQGGAAYLCNRELPQGVGWHWRRWHRLLRDEGMRSVLVDSLPSASRLSRDLSERHLAADTTMRHLAQSPRGAPYPPQPGGGPNGD